MSCKWILFIALAFGAAHAAPAPDAAQLKATVAENTHVQSLEDNFRAMGQSVASHTSDVISTAISMIGIPYRRGGTTAESGFDCSGFVRAMYSQALGHVLPRAAYEQAKATKKIEKRELQPGDLVFFNTMRRAFSHVGIYLGDGKFIHSPSRGKRVRIEDMNASYWSKRFNGARRVDGIVSTRATAPTPSAPSVPVDLHLDLDFGLDLGDGLSIQRVNVLDGMLE